MYEYNDTKDYADVMMYKGNATNWNIYDFTNFTWDAIGENSNVDLNYLKIMATQQLNTTFQNGTLAFEVRLVLVHTFFSKAMIRIVMFVLS